VDRSCADRHYASGKPSRDVAVLGLLLVYIGWARALRKAPAKRQNPNVLVRRLEEASTRSNAPRGRTRQTDRAIVSATRGEFAVAHVETADGQLPPDPGEGAQPSTPVWSRSAPERRLSPLVRFCMAAGLLTAASSGVFLLSNSATGPVAAAIILAKEVWAVAPNSAHSTGQAMQNATTRSIEKVPPTGSAPIPAPLPATPAAEDAVATPTAPAVQPDAARPSAEPAAPAVQPDAANPSAEPAAPSAEHAVAAPAAVPVQLDAATPSAAPGLRHQPQGLTPRQLLHHRQRVAPDCRRMRWRNFWRAATHC